MCVMSATTMPLWIHPCLWWFPIFLNQNIHCSVSLEPPCIHCILLLWYLTWLFNVKCPYTITWFFTITCATIINIRFISCPFEFSLNIRFISCPFEFSFYAKAGEIKPQCLKRYFRIFAPNKDSNHLCIRAVWSMPSMSAGRKFRKFAS